jgi:hypothetical protein
METYFVYIKHIANACVFHIRTSRIGGRGMVSVDYSIW